MKNLLKQFAGWVTLLKNDTFESARIKLTGYYIFAVIISVGLLTWLVRSVFIATIKSDIEYKFIVLTYGVDTGKKFIEASSAHLFNVLLWIDYFVVFVVSVFGFFFASKTLKPVRNAMHKQRAFVSDAAHELRTPLAIMKTEVETLIDKDMSKEEVSELKKDILDEVNELIEITNNLLLLHELDENVGNGKKEEVNLSEILSAESKYFISYAKHKDIRYITDIDKGIKIFITKSKAMRLVRNIIKNALDYTDSKGVVHVSLKKISKNNIVFKVKDTGVGIPKDEIKNIFNRFYTVKNDLSHTNGSGLGLAIVNEIVLSVKGDIEVQSELGKGSTFIVTLPSA